MNQAELVINTAQVSGVSKKDVEHVLKTAADVIHAALAEGGDVPLPGLGKLVVQRKAAREARNPKTGAIVLVPARNAVKFRPAKVLKDAANA